MQNQYAIAVQRAATVTAIASLTIPLFLGMIHILTQLLTSADFAPAASLVFIWIIASVFLLSKDPEAIKATLAKKRSSHI